MGCDIHLYQEKKVNGKWIAADDWVVDPEYPGEGPSVKYDARLYSGRNYDLFAILANVRNGYGFAGVITGDVVKPIAMPRGVPEDACQEYLAEVRSWEGDGHSHSWITLADLEAYPWDEPKIHKGMVQVSEYLRWKETGDKYPSDYCGGISGPGILHITEEAVRRLTEEEKSSDRIYVESLWTTSKRDCATKFLEVVLPRLRELEAECGEGNARLVFFFDN